MQQINTDLIFQALALLWLIYISWLIYNRVAPKIPAGTIRQKPKPVPVEQNTEQLENARFLFDRVAYEIVDNRRHVYDIIVLCTDKINNRADYNEVLRTIEQRMRSIKSERKDAFKQFVDSPENLKPLKSSLQNTLRQYRDKLAKYENLFQDLASFYEKSVQKMHDKGDLGDRLAEEKRLCILGCKKKSEKLLRSIEEIEQTSSKLEIV